MCSPNDGIIGPLSCLDPVGDAQQLAGSVAGSVAGSATDQFFNFIADGARDLLTTVSTFWLKVPDPQVAHGSGQSWTGNSTITSIQSWLSPAALTVFLISVGIAVIRVGFDARRAQEGMNGFMRALAATLAGGLPLMAVTMLLLQAGDEFSPWVLKKASGQSTSQGFADVFAKAMFGSETGLPGASGVLLIVYLLAIVAGLVQVLFMVVRGAAVICLLGFAQVTAAGAGTEEGWLRFKRIGMLIVGFVLYKPVAAIVYATGLKLMSDGATTQDQTMNAIYGLAVFVMAGLALPTVIKFVAPPAAMGSSSAFSGGAAVGAMATGAAMVALAGTGGGGAGAGVGSGAGASNVAGGGPEAAGDAGGGGEHGASSAGDPHPSPQDNATGGTDSDWDGGSAATGAEQQESTRSGGFEGAADGGREAAGQGATGGAADTPGGGGSAATQFGAQTIANLTQQVNRAGEDAAAQQQEE